MSTATLQPAATMRTPIKDLLSNATATGARLLAGMVLFVVMGRVLGPAAFGNFMAAMATAALLAFGANLGFAQQSLREIAAHPGQAARIVGNLASAKLTLALQCYGYGAAFAELQALWLWLARLVALCAAAARYGVQLTAMGRQAMRSVVNMGSLALMVAVLLTTTAAGHGLQGVVLALLTGAAFVLVVYRRQVRQQGSTA